MIDITSDGASFQCTVRYPGYFVT